MFGTAFRWGFPLLGLAFLLWGSLFLYYPIEISPLDALNAFFPNGDELAKITVVDLRFPRALVAIALGVITNHHPQPTSLTNAIKRQFRRKFGHGNGECH